MGRGHCTAGGPPPEIGSVIGAVIEMEQATVATSASASVAWIVKAKSPPTFGVPDTTPVAAFSASPGGRLPETMAKV